MGKKTHDKAPKKAGKILSTIHKTDRLKRSEIDLEERVRPHFSFTKIKQRASLITNNQSKIGVGFKNLNDEDLFNDSFAVFL